MSFFEIDLRKIFYFDIFFAVIFVCLNKIRKLQKSVKVLSEEIAKQKTLFIESGNAITATLKIAFDNIKTLNHGQDRIKKEFKENVARKFEEPLPFFRATPMIEYAVEIEI